MAIREQNCEVCEHKKHNNSDGWCYMFLKKVKCCGQFKPVLSKENEELKNYGLKLFPKFGKFLGSIK